jgi:hypothetical protein
VELMNNKNNLWSVFVLALRGITIYVASHCLVVAQERDGTEVDLLKELITVPGVSGREEQIRELIRTRLPRWARNASRVDAIGNLIVTVGSGEPAVLYVAHMDEIGYWVTNIRDDGRLQVQTTGGSTIANTKDESSRFIQCAAPSMPSWQCLRFTYKANLRRANRGRSPWTA